MRLTEKYKVKAARRKNRFYKYMRNYLKSKNLEKIRSNTTSSDGNLKF